jgi:hypothetical protein
MFGQSVRICVRCEQGFDFRPQFWLARAGLVEKCLPFARVAFEG